MLQDLYSKLAMMTTKIRMDSYHKLVSSNKRFDITNVLHRHVDDLASRAGKVRHHSGTALDDEHQQERAQESRDEKRTVNDENVSGVESEFAGHLKQRQSSPVSQPYIAEKLTASTWEHIHSAIRYARQGDVDNAKLHTDIAGQALEEAGHFLNDTEYSELITQIEHYFTDSQNID